jgi:hypothetical protein
MSPHWLRTGVLVTAAGIVIAAVVALLLRSGSEPPVVGPTPGPTSTTSTSPPPETTPPTTAPPPPSRSAGAGATGIADLEPVAYQLCARPGFGGANWSAEAVELGDELRQNSRSCPLDHPSEAGYLEYLVPDGSTELNGLVGIADTSPNTDARVLFEVLSVDNSGRVLWEGEAGYGAPLDLHAPLTDTSRVRLQVSVADFPTTDRGPAAYASFADMEFG